MEIAEHYMQRAIELAHEGMRSGKGGPFGAVIVKDGKIIAEGQNQVTSLNDPTAHAEIQAIRAACNKLNHFSLAGCEIYTSCEPCPMCLSAIYWARLDKIYFAGTREDAAAIGFDDAQFYNEIAKNINERNTPQQQLLHNKILEIFSEWKTMVNKINY